MTEQQAFEHWFLVTEANDRMWLQHDGERYLDDETAEMFKAFRGGLASAKSDQVTAWVKPAALAELGGCNGMSVWLESGVPHQAGGQSTAGMVPLYSGK